MAKKSKHKTETIVVSSINTLKIVHIKKKNLEKKEKYRSWGNERSEKAEIPSGGKAM